MASVSAFSSPSCSVMSLGLRMRSRNQELGYPVSPFTLCKFRKKLLNRSGGTISSRVLIIKEIPDSNFLYCSFMCMLLRWIKLRVKSKTDVDFVYWFLLPTYVYIRLGC